MEVHLVVNTVLLIFVALGFIWSVLRELHIHAMQRSQERAADKLADHLGNVNRLLEASGRLVEQVAREVNESGALTREKRTEMIGYFRDIEKRILDAIHENREWLRDHFSHNQHGTSIYNTNAHGGQTNQGGNVRGDQS